MRKSKNRVILTKGLPASGKSSWAIEQVEISGGDWVRVSRDDLRRMLHNYKFSGTREKLVLKARDWLIEEILKSGKGVIVDETSLNPKVEKRVSDVANRAVASYYQGSDKFPIVKVEIQEFDKPLQQCVQDDLKRPHSVGEGVIRRMHNQWIASKKPKAEPIEGLPYCIVCDLDGTIADISHRDPYDGGKCDKDSPREPVVNIINAMRTLGYSIVFLSGRDDEHYDKTVTWLREHLADHTSFYLYMRNTGDRRDDTIVKEEMLRRHVLSKFNVYFVIDDRPKVIRMWRDLGLFVFDVGDGIEF